MEGREKNIKRVIAVFFLMLGVAGFKCLGYLPETTWRYLFVMIASVLLLATAFSVLICRERLVPNAARLFIGLIFMYSGFVKAVDPLGSKYKFIDYFSAWGMDFMEPLSLWLGIVLSTMEFVVGAALFFNTLTKYASIGALLFMLFFTPVTLYLALQEQTSGKELVHDCGCFGDALILTNWQTFIKNLFIMLPIGILLAMRKKFSSIFICKAQVGAVILFVIFSSGLSVYALLHLPPVDFRPYKAGTYIPDGMIIPDDAPQPVYSDPVFILKKDGVEKEFTMDNYPTEPGWEFVERKIDLINPGYIPPIHDFTITSDEEGDITEKVLSDERPLFLVIAYDLSQASVKHQDQLHKLYLWALKNDCDFMCLTASTDADIEKFKNETGAKYPFNATDPITLKTIVRSNPGVVLLKQGTIIDKWHINDLPDTKKMKIIVETN